MQNKSYITALAVVITCITASSRRVQTQAQDLIVLPTVTKHQYNSDHEDSWHFLPPFGVDLC